MSIESKEVRDIYALYQNINENARRDEFEKRKERIRNPFGNTTIVTKDGKELKQGDDGFDDALSKARQTVRDANNKSLNAADRKANEKSGLGSGSSSSSSSSTVVKKDTPKDTPPAPKTQRDEVVTKKDTNNTPPAPKTQRDEVVTKGGPDRSKTQPNPEKEEKPTPRIRRGQGNRPIASNPNRQGGEPFKKLLQQKQQEKSDKENDVGSDGKPVTPNNRGASINVNRDGSPKPKPGNLSNIGNAIKAGQTDAGKELVKSVTTPAPKKVDAPAPKPEKITARTQMRQRNIDRFGADGPKGVNALMDKQKAFKSMQAKSMMPGAKPGAAKAEFAKNFPTSNVAKDLKKSKRVTQVMDLESYDAFDIVLGYLSESGQVDSMDEALYIMLEMDAATIQGIVRDFEMLTEEEADRMKDERLEKYGIGHDGSDRKAGSGGRSDSKKPKGKTNLQKETEKKHGKGKSPLDVAKANIIAKYGKGAIAPSKKKKK